MLMKKFLFLFVASSLALSACGNQETEKHTEKKNVQTKKEKQDNRQPEDNKKISVENVANNKNTVASDNNYSNYLSNQEGIDASKVTNRAELDKIMTGNYSEVEKLNAYNNAVAEGVIPQGNVMEGPPEAAYQSSLNIEKGTEVPPSYHMYDNYGNTAVKQKTLDNNQPQATSETQKQSAVTNNPQH